MGLMEKRYVEDRTELDVGYEEERSGAGDWRSRLRVRSQLGIRGIGRIAKLTGVSACGARGLEKSVEERMTSEKASSLRYLTTRRQGGWVVPRRASYARYACNGAVYCSKRRHGAQQTTPGIALHASLFYSSIALLYWWRKMAMILDAFVGIFVDKLTSLVGEKVVMVLGAKDELRRLQRRMVRIQKFLEAAERRRLEDPDINHWVSELKDIAYDADDIIDLCRIQGALLLVNQPSSSKKTLVCFNFSLPSSCFASVPHRYQIAESIKSLNNRLEEIYQDRLHFNLESKEKKKYQMITVVNTRQTTSLVEFDVVGSEIEEATKELVTLIVEEQMNRCRVFAITGMGVNTGFSPKDNSLLSLFRNPLQSAGAFVRILVTTRDINVAREIGVAHIHPVMQLSIQTSWEILCRRIFVEGEENEISKLADLGIQIVGKCSGLPLAIKAIAELGGALYLSCDDLPSSLKQCFLYCFLFPEDKSLDRVDLVRLWVAGGFVKEQSDLLVEDVTEDYYNELIRRNLLQPDPYDPTELLNDNQLVGLARLRVLRMDNVDIESIPNSIGDLIHLRYINLNETNFKELPELVGSLTNLQFLNLRACPFLTTLPKSITKLHNLRGLGLYNSPLNSIPKGISKLEKINDLSGFVVADPSEPVYSSTPLPTEDDITRIEDVLEELCPPQCLERLHIQKFFGRHYLRWMKSPSFGERLPQLTTLELSKNISCTQLPPTGELPQLNNLIISGATSVKNIGPEFLGIGVAAWDVTNTPMRIAFPTLQSLILHRIPELEEWTFDKEMEGFVRRRGMAHVLPRLDQLFINHCPKLKALLKGLEQSKIKTLQILGAHSLREVENLPNVMEQLSLFHNQSLERVSYLHALHILRINYCPALNCVEKLNSLQQLHLFDIFMEGLPEWLARLVEERKLATAAADDDFLFQLLCNERLLWRLLKGGPDWWIIEKIPRVFTFDNAGKGFQRYTRNPFFYYTNMFVID
ncbi:hypothetical protein IEQ34_014640 [Dendrobium chrysotoxum]|uniref:Uncharacterized protein n=1 Tax=Dendrobium chrysotoxum TaxID=161865 RepID=A0AAV7GM17_DENCH|nr:hypothetical protein IEQ34_014640 [Dendrobium chrysotoxum]